MTGLSAIEPFLSVRHYYILLNRGAERGTLRKVIGHDHRRVLRSAISALNKINKGGCPQLRPKGVWDDCLEEKASVATSFGRLLVNHGLEKGDITLLEPHLAAYAGYRLRGSVQRDACSLSGNPRKVSLDDEVVHKLQVRKYPNFKPERVVLKKWTRGAVNSYSRMRVKWGGCVINKLGLKKPDIVAASKFKFGPKAWSVMTDIAILSHRIVRLFNQSLINREILEFSEASPREFDSILKAVSLEDWRVITLNDTKVVRCYWKASGVKWVGTNRTEESGDCVMSSFDIPMSMV